MNTEPNVRELSSAQVRALRDCHKGDPGASCRGRSEHGGRVATLCSLRKRGFLYENNKISGSGLHELAKHDPDVKQELLNARVDPIGVTHRSGWYVHPDTKNRQRQI